jgi:hypothetical protein
MSNDYKCLYLEAKNNLLRLRELIEEFLKEEKMCDCNMNISEALHYVNQITKELNQVENFTIEYFKNGG